MSKGREQAVQFVNGISKLYENIQNWLASTNLQGSREEIELEEQACGAYKAEKLSIGKGDGTKVAELVPVAANVIGAGGRVDLVGRLDRVILVKLGKDAPSGTVEAKSGGYEETVEKEFFNGVEEAGWYWIEDKRRGKAHKLDKSLFFELLTEVSDYEAG